MRKDENRRYIKAGITGVIVLSVVILLTFALYRLDAIMGGINVLLRILTPFIYGIVIAYILAPSCGKFEKGLEGILGEKRHGLCSGLAILISLLIFILIIVLLILIVIPQAVQSAVSIMNALPGQIMDLNSRIEEMVSLDPELEQIWNSINTQVINWLQSFRDKGIMPMAQKVLSGTAVYVSATLRIVSNVILGIVITVYLLATRKLFAAQARLLLRSIFSTLWADRIEQEVLYADEMFNGFFMGKLLDSAIVGVICFIGCMLMRFSSAPLIGVVVGVTNIIPFFGPFIGAIPCALLLLLENPVHCLMFLVFILVLQQIDGDIIGPRILGNTTGLSGFWVTFAIILFGGLWGIVGMIIGVPLFAVIYDVVRRLCIKGLRYRGRDDMIDAYNETFHAPVEPKPRKKRLR